MKNYVYLVYGAGFDILFHHLDEAEEHLLDTAAKERWIYINDYENERFDFSTYIFTSEEHPDPFPMFIHRIEVH
jgi:hypothetical protein